MALVSLGSCIFSICSVYAFEDGPEDWDASRVAAAIPSGVGFLGAGLIWKIGVQHGSVSYSKIRGLTTAASMWVSASVGIAAGGKLYFVAGFGVLILVLMLR